MTWTHHAEKAVSDSRTERASVYSGRPPFRQRPDGPAQPRECLKAIKLRLTLFLQPNHGFGESFCGSRAGAADLSALYFSPLTALHRLRWSRPEDSPNPSIRASVPSISDRRALMSRNQARWASLASSPRASSASFSSLSKEWYWRCKETSWCQVARTSSRAAPARAPHTATVVIAPSTL